MTYKLVARMVEFSADANPNKKWNSSFIGVLPINIEPEPKITAMRNAMVSKYELMCDAIDGDIQNPEGSGAQALEEIRRIEAGEIDRIEADGNAWVTYITREKVWFEGLYSQGEGGEVSFAQYKLAVQTYVRFLSDPERKPIEVPFPEQ